MYLGDAYYATKQYDMALAAYNSAAGIDPKSADAVNGLGLVYIVQNNLPLARKQYDALLPLNKDMADKLLAKIDAASKNP